MPEESNPDPVFGELGYDPPMEQWYAKVALTPGHEVEVAIWWDETEGPFDPVLKRARAAFQRFLRSEHRHKESLAAAMLERYRTQAAADQILPATAEIARGLCASHISIAHDGSMSVYYRGGEDMFGDHSILADFAADGTFDGFSLQG